MTPWATSYQFGGLSQSSPPRRLLTPGQSLLAATRDPHNTVCRVALIPADPNQAPADAVTSPRLQIRLVSDNSDAPQSEQLTDPRTEQPLSVSRKVLLDETSIDQVSLAGQSEGKPAIALTMTEEGARQLKAITGANIGRRLAIVFDGRVLMAPTIRSIISHDVLIDLGAAERRQAQNLVGQLHAAINSLPQASAKLHFDAKSVDV